MSTSDRLREKLARLSPMLQRDILLMLELNRKLPTPYRTWIGIVENATIHEENGKAIIKLTVAVPFDLSPNEIAPEDLDDLRNPCIVIVHPHRSALTESKNPLVV